MENKKPLLTLYIPIYNRSIYLERMLKVFSEDKDLFKEKIYLTVSDNCSTEDLKGICDKYISDGLNVHYQCNETNIGGDGNIMQGFLTAKGKYVWVLGSDDIPVSGFLRNMIPQLEKEDYGVFHLAQYADDSRQLKVYNDGNKFFEDIHVWITFVSDNIVATEFVKDIDFNKYRQTSFTQMPLYLTAGLSGKKNAIYPYSWIQNGNDSAANGGYNLFEVFVHQFLWIVHEQVENGKLSKKSYAIMKRKELSFVNGFIERLLIKREKTNWDKGNGWSILWKYYKGEWYFYCYMIFIPIRMVLCKIKLTIIR